MIEALVMAAVLNTGPDHLVEPVNMRSTRGWLCRGDRRRNHPKKWRPFATCVWSRESGGTWTR